MELLSNQTSFRLLQAVAIVLPRYVSYSVIFFIEDILRASNYCLDSKQLRSSWDAEY